MLRWAIAASEVADAAVADALVRLLEPDDAEHVQRYRNAEDRRLALLSRLMQRAAGGAALGLGATRNLRRRAAAGRGRPFLCRATASRSLASADDAAKEALDAAPNWNYSASHEGGWVALCAEPLTLCGCDVASPRQRRRPGRRQGFLASVALLRDCFADAEWAAVERSLKQRRPNDDGDGGGGDGGDGDGDDDQAEVLAEAAFSRLWAVKEAFVKARGDGLAFAPLSRVEAVWEGGEGDQQPPAFADAAAIAGAARRGSCLAVGTLSIDGGPPQWGRWAVAVHPLPAAEGDEKDAEPSLSPRTPGVGPAPPPPPPPPARYRRRCWLAVVRGPPSETAPRELHPEFVDSLARRFLDGEELRRAVGGPWAPVRGLKVEDLLMDDDERAAVAAARAGAGASASG
jgi:4'-phosphopantetheinyl transferase